MHFAFRDPSIRARERLESLPPQQTSMTTSFDSSSGVYREPIVIPAVWRTDLDRSEPCA